MELSLGKLKHIDPRTLWKNEAGDFTPSLADNLTLLGEALGLDLQLEQTEGAVGDFACDIVAREVGTNRPVIIENQLERTDHNHLGQLLTYAGGLDAAVVVWISPEVRDEHRKALDWLNRHTDDEIDFFGVVVEAIRIDESKPAVQFRPVAVPNEFGKRPPAAATSERGLIYKTFFQGVVDELREKHKFTNVRVANAYNWQNFSSGFSGLVYSLAFSAGGLRAALEINTPNAERNKAISDWFRQQKDVIEAEMGENLVWDQKENRRYIHIYAVRPDTLYADAVAHADELRNWSIDYLLRLKKIFGPKLSEALTATAPYAALETA
ncbi:MAG TPA: DUF4268 domain-containing protein [Stellaceae bacterium]|nr:DUF4268 domain-containing protein [Stellaceae bacterium]